MKEQLYAKLNLRIIASEFKEIRLQKGYSLRGIADAANLSHVIISDFENGRNYPNLETLVLLFKQLDIDFCIDTVLLTSYKNTIDLLYEAIYYKYPDQVKKQCEVLMKAEPILKNSLLEIDYQLARLTFAISVKNAIDFEKIHALERYYDFFSEKQKQVFNLITGAAYFKKEKIEKAIDYLKRNMTIYGVHKAHALTLSYLANSYIKLFHHTNALYYAKEASSFHGENASFVRKISSDLTLAKLYIEIAQYQEAQKIISSIELTIEGEEHPTLYQEMWFLKAYIEYRKGNYKLALKQYQNRHFNVVYSHLFEAFIFVQMKQIDEAVKRLEKGLSKEYVIKDFVYSRMYRIALAHFNGIYEDQHTEEWCLELLNVPQRLPDFHHYRFVFESLLKYYETQEDFEKAYKLAKEYIRRTGKTLLFEK